MTIDRMFPSRCTTCLALASILGIGALVLGPGCSSPERRGRPPMERMGPPQNTLAGQTTFFGGAIEAHVTLRAYNAGGPGASEPPGGGPSGNGPGGMPSGSSGGGGGPGAGLSIGMGGGPSIGMGGGMGGGGGPGGGMGGGGPGGGMGGGGPGGGMGGGMGGPPPGETSGGSGGPSGAGPGPMNAMPRHTLQVAFANTSPANFEFAVIEVKSLLGNFVPRPTRLALAPGQTSNLQSMNSAMTETFDALDVTLTLRHGDQRETQVIHLTLTSP